VDDPSIVSLFIFLAGQTIAIWRKLQSIEDKLNVAADEQQKQKKRIIGIEQDLSRIKHLLGLT